MAFHSNLAYEASAGSGKTFALVIRYISLLYMGAKADGILALTFTNKAANEMSVRVATVLKELHLKSRENELNELCNTLSMSKEEVLNNQKKVLDNFLASEIKISTIDKFFASILRSFSLHVGLMPDFAIEESENEDLFLENFIQEVKQADIYNELVSFSAYEKKRLQNIFEFLAKLHEKDGELSNTSLGDDNYKVYELKILTKCKELKDLFLSCDKLSAAAKKALEITSIEALINKSWLEKDTLEYHYFKKCFVSSADDLFFEIKELLKSYFCAKENFFKKEYFKLYKIYQNTKNRQNKTTNILGFNDVSYYVHKLLRGEIDSEFLYFRLDSKIEHILIDEFQDTNVIQYRILEPLIEEINAGIGTKDIKTFFYVGDIKQSIYRFRGGAKELFHFTQENFAVKLKQLNSNYRSRYQIVEFVNSVFRDKIANYVDQISHDKSKGGYVKVTIHEDILSSVVKEAFKLLEMGVNSDDIAILTYANTDAFEIKDALLEKDPTLTIFTETTKKLIHNRQVSAVINLLKYLYFNEALYKANFLTTIGLSWDEELQREKLSIATPLPKLIVQIIERFKLFNRDDNLLTLIELAHTYSDIEEFLFEIDTLSMDAPSQKSKGIRLLTIHKSKGLEFEHIIVADRFKRKSSDTSSVIFDYDNIYLKDIYVKFKNRVSVDENYNAAVQRQKILSHEDELNVQYVAFTRAKESLIICQKEKSSSFNNLDLQECDIGGLEFDQKESIVEEEPKLEYESIKVGLQNEKSNAKTDSKIDNIQAVNFGIAMHYMLELMKDFNKSSIDSAYWGMKNRYEFVLEEGMCEEIRDRVEMLIKNVEFLELTDGKKRKEQPISYNGELKQIDLIVEKEDKVIVIDYKSSQEMRSEHLKQVQHYKKAIQKIYLQEVEAYLCYIRKEEIVLTQI